MKDITPAKYIDPAEVDFGQESLDFLSQVPQPLLREICGVAWPHSLATVPLCQLVLTPEPISGAY